MLFDHPVTSTGSGKPMSVARCGPPHQHSGRLDRIVLMIVSTRAR